VDMTLCMSQSLDNAIALPHANGRSRRRRGRHENLKRLTAVKDLNKKKSSSGPASRVHHFRNYGRDSTYQPETCSNKPSHLYGWPPFPTIKPRANWSSATAKSSGRK